MEKELVMSRRIGCPHCGKQLNVPSEWMGRKVVCPRCATQFRSEPDEGGEPASSVTVTPQNPDLYPPGAAPVSRTAAFPKKSVPEKESPNKTDPNKTGPEKGGPEKGGPEKGGPERDASPRTAGDGATMDEPPKALPRSGPQTARFIKRDANATKVKLGADGQLPDLALATQEKRVETDGGSQASNPWVLISVLCISVLLSVLILVIDEPLPGQTAGKGAARQQLEVIFTSWDRTDAPALEIRDLLARALQAYNRGDDVAEEKYYRQILNLLNREDAPKYGGYSGDDNALKETLSELLR